MVETTITMRAVGSPATPTPEPTSTLTPEPTPTSEPMATATPTPEPTSTATPEPTATSTQEPTAPPTEVPSPQPTTIPTEVPTIEATAVPTEVPPIARPTDLPLPQPTVTPTTVPTIDPTPETTPLPTAGPTESDDDETVIEQMSLSITMPGVDLPEGAVLCLDNPDFSGCAALLPSPVASARATLLIQATSTYIATFADLPEGTYALTIPPIGSFPGYRGSITVDRAMPSVIAIYLPVVPSIPDGPDLPELPNDPEGPEPPGATPNTDDPVPSPDARDDPDPAPLPAGDGTSGGAGSGPERSRPVEHSSRVTMLPSTGAGRFDAPGLVPLGVLMTLSLLVLLWAMHAARRERR